MTSGAARTDVWSVSGGRADEELEGGESQSAEIDLVDDPLNEFDFCPGQLSLGTVGRVGEARKGIDIALVLRSAGGVLRGDP